MAFDVCKSNSILTLLLLSVLVGSCIFKLPNLTDNAYENINDVSIRLVVRNTKDSLVRTDYEKQNNLPGNICAKLETVDQLDSNKTNGVAIRFWTEVVMNEQGTFYGAFPKNGMLEKISKLNVILSANHLEKDITKELLGDSTITAYVWKKNTYKKAPTSTYMHNGGLKPAYFENTEDCTTGLNERADSLEWVSRYDYLFWFNNKILSTLNFEPEWLKIRMTLTDSTCTKNRILTDSIALVKH